ncbi:MAG: ABC transporter permease [Clostridia bacterium]|nr:ABC transporter permease [Clostridia bacterium]
MFLNILLQILEQGLCYALVAMGVYISYKILDFPDLTVDGSFPFGAVVCIGLMKVGCPFFIALIGAFIAGGVAGLITGLLHVKLRISNLLSGIITMTALLSINLGIALAVDSSTLIPYSNVTSAPTLFENKFIDLFGSNIHVQAIGCIIILVTVVVIFKVLLDLFLKTKTGFMLRAVGNNEQMCTSLGCNCGTYKILGLVIANAMVGVAGAIYSQYMTFYDNASGTGMVVLALASVIIGCALFKNIKFIKGTTASIIGALIYTAALNIVIAAGVPTTYLKLVMAVIFAIILVVNGFVLNKDKKIKKEAK